MKFLYFLNRSNPNDAAVSASTVTKKLLQTVDGVSINAAYTSRYKEIESLRKYDRGEKTIIAPRLTDIVHSI